MILLESTPEVTTSLQRAGSVWHCVRHHPESKRELRLPLVAEYLLAVSERAWNPNGPREQDPLLDMLPRQ